jgi:hypothetical protein
LAIQHTDCPRCAATVATYITRCGCGFSFEGIEDTEPTQRLEALAEEERLYEDYLAARASQAIAEATEAERAMLEEPDNYYRTSRAERAVATREAMLAELYQQKLRATEILASIEAAKTYSKKVRALNPHKHKPQEHNHAAPVPAPAVVEPAVAAKPAIEKTVVVMASTPAAAVVANIKTPTAAPMPKSIAATPVTDVRLASPAVPARPVVLAPTVVVALTADTPPAKADEVGAYTAKLEEILLNSKRAAPPTRPAERATAAVSPTPKAPQTPPLAAADHRAAGPVVTDGARTPAAPAISAATPPPTMRPEELLEHASKAIRVRAVAMATRLYGAADTETRTATNAPHAARIETPATLSNEATRTYGKAARPKPTEPAQVASAPAVVESAEGMQKENPARAEQASQAYAKYPHRSTRTHRIKQEQPTAAVKVAASPVPSMPTAPPQPPPEPYIDDRPSAIFRAIQAAKAEKIVQAANLARSLELKQCRFCAATHVADVKHCGCGYLLEESIELPELVLSSKERAELIEDGIQIKRPQSPGKNRDRC